MQYTGQAGHLLGKLCVDGTGQFIVECSDLSAECSYQTQNLQQRLTDLFSHAQDVLILCEFSGDGFAALSDLQLDLQPGCKKRKTISRGHGAAGQCGARHPRRHSCQDRQRAAPPALLPSSAPLPRVSLANIQLTLSYIYDNYIYVLHKGELP